MTQINQRPKSTHIVNRNRTQLKTLDQIHHGQNNLNLNTQSQANIGNKAQRRPKINFAAANINSGGNLFGS